MNHTNHCIGQNNVDHLFGHNSLIFLFFFYRPTVIGPHWPWANRSYWAYCKSGQKRASAKSLKCKCSRVLLSNGKSMNYPSGQDWLEWKQMTRCREGTMLTSTFDWGILEASDKSPRHLRGAENTGDITPRTCTVYSHWHVCSVSIWRTELKCGISVINASCRCCLMFWGEFPSRQAGCSDGKDFLWSLIKNCEPYIHHALVSVLLKGFHLLYTSSLVILSVLCHHLAAFLLGSSSSSLLQNMWWQYKSR